MVNINYISNIMLEFDKICQYNFNGMLSKFLNIYREVMRYCWANKENHVS